MGGLKHVAFVLAVVFFLCSFNFAIAKGKVSGEELVRDFWKNMAEGNIEALKNTMADGFQSIHQDGARSKEEELKLIENLQLGEYKLDNFKTTSYKNIVIVTYTVAVTHETIDGKLMTTKPMPRMTIFAVEKKGYKILAHANLEEISSK